ncbi:MAG: CBS domain-containing protein [Cyclobacteriaceae bacterium]
MKISASLYSSKERTLPNLVNALDKCHIDYFHIDCNDNMDVFKDIEEIKKISKTPIDLHIISDRPEDYLPLIEKHGVEYVTFQYENIPSRLELPDLPGTRWGLAITSDTSIQVFEDYKDSCDFILMMTTTPGQSGGKFRKENFKKIRKFRNQYPDKKIYVDGGVNDETGFILRILGVHSVVSGSYLVNHESIGEALLHLRSSIIHSDFRIKDFMIDIEDAPVLDMQSTKVKDIIRQIDDFNLGFTLLKDAHGKLAGISSNADVRKGLLKHLDDFNAMKLEDIVNTNPVSISEDATISELLQMIQSKSFLISYLPVVNSQNTLTGALSFIHLIRSES